VTAGGRRIYVHSFPDPNPTVFLFRSVPHKTLDTNLNFITIFTVSENLQVEHLGELHTYRYEYDIKTDRGETELNVKAGLGHNDSYFRTRK
jgi:hypothetical protein